MDRRGFLGLIGCGAGAVVLGPLLPAPEPVGLRFAGPAQEAFYGGALGGGKTNLMQRYYNAAWNQILDHRNMTTNPIAVHKDAELLSYFGH